ncbi:MAG: lysylphosphatidylglycerol synthase domain-containing protein [Thermoleophilia bacterium]
MPTPPEVAAPAPASPLRRWGGLAAGLLILGFLAFALVDGWKAVSEYDWDLDPWLLALACLVLGVFYVLSGLGYVAIQDEMHHPGPPRRVTLAIWAKSLLGRYVPGNVLMVVGRVVLAYERGVPRRVTLGATTYEQVLTLGVAALAAVLYVAFYAGDDRSAGLWFLALVPLGLVFLHPKVFGPLTSWALRKAGREPLPRLIAMRHLLALLAWYILVAVVLGVGIWLGVRAAAGPDAGGAAEIGLAFLLSFAVSMVAFIFPSGLGVREGAFALALAQNLPTGVAVALSVGTRLVLTLVELVVIAILVLVGRDR